MNAVSRHLSRAGSLPQIQRRAVDLDLDLPRRKAERRFCAVGTAASLPRCPLRRTCARPSDGADQDQQQDQDQDQDQQPGVVPVGASLLAKDVWTPRSFRQHAFHVFREQARSHRGVRETPHQFCATFGGRPVCGNDHPVYRLICPTSSGNRCTPPYSHPENSHSAAVRRSDSPVPNCFPPTWPLADWHH